MTTVPGSVDTDSQPPLSIPLRHFVVALAFLLAGAGLGVVDALGAAPGLARLAHLHLLLVGFVCLTIAGAMTQFVPVWAGTPLHSRRLARAQLWLVGGGVAGFAAGLLAGRLAGSAAVARAGGALVLAGVAAFAVIFVRRLRDARAGRTPMLARYALLAPALFLWIGATAPAWLRTPLAEGVVFGAPGTGHLLAMVFVLVLVGTLYHIVPFLVWVHRYSDLLGFEDVPMIDDLYDGRLETLDLVLVAAGGAALAGGDWMGLAPVSLGGGVALTVGLVVFVSNLALVVWRYAPESLYGGAAPEPTGD